MKNGFIILLLIFTLFLRCVTLVHGTRVLLFPGRMAADAVWDDKPLPLRSRPLLAGRRKLKTQSFNVPFVYKEQRVSNEYHPLGHPVPPPGMYTPRQLFIVFRLLPDKYIPVKSILLPAERATPNNKGSPELTTALLSTIFYFINHQYATNDPYFYTSLFFPSTACCSLILTQQGLPKQFAFFIVPDNALLPAPEPGGTNLPTFPLLTSWLVNFRYSFPLPSVFSETTAKVLFGKTTIPLSNGSMTTLMSSLCIHLTPPPK